MTHKIDQSIIRNQNRAHILKAFRANQIIQKKDLVEHLNLSITTVTTITKQLLDEGLIEMVGFSESTGGRKPLVFQFIKDASVAFGVDISPHTMHIIMVNLCSEIIDQEKMTYEDTPIKDLLESLKGMIHAMLKKHQYTMDRCLGVGLSLPGIVDSDQKQLIHAPNLNTHVYDFQSFSQMLGCEVFVENEANVAAFAELILGDARAVDHAVFVSISEGVGCGIISDHKVVKGTYHKAGEFGHMRVSSAPHTCRCGRSGCWELYASESALLNAYRQHSDNPKLELDDFFAAYEKDEHEVQGILKAYLEDLMVGVENIMLGLDPQVIIIGGKIISRLRHAVPDLNVLLKERHHTIFSAENKVMFSQMSPFSALVGSSLLPLKEMFGF